MRYRRGFTLTEILLAISLLVVFMLLASRLIAANFHVASSTLKADSNAARFDQATRMLRMDIANSIAAEMPQAALLRIHSNSNQTIDWRIGLTTITRIASNQTRSWEVGFQLNLKLDGAVVLLSANRLDQIAMARMPQGTSR